jgi:uncharacterized membrane protein
MSFQKVEAGRGLEWLKKAFALVMANPGVFLVMALIIGVLGAIPVINLAMIVIGPALSGGMIYAMREQDNGGRAEIGQLFAAFQQQGKIGPMLLLCLPAIAGFVVILVLTFIFGGAAILGMMAGGASGSTGASAAGIGGLFLLMVCVLVIVFLIAALTFFAIPRVMLDSVEPFQAMKESLSAVLGNILPMLVYGLIMLVSFFVLAIVIGWIPILGILVLMTLYYAISCGASYAAYVDVFGVSTAAPVEYMPPAPPPSM